MDVYEKSVEWFRENFIVYGTEEEFKFMRYHALNLRQGDRFWDKPLCQFIAASVSNGKNNHIMQKLSEIKCIREIPFDVTADDWVYLSNKASEWHDELESLRFK